MSQSDQKKYEHKPYKKHNKMSVNQIFRLMELYKKSFYKNEDNEIVYKMPLKKEELQL